MKAQDFDAVGGAASDGTNVMKLQVRLRSANDVYSPWYNIRIAILDVSDDPITAPVLIAESGATGGYVFNGAVQDVFWADTAMTVPAQVGQPVAAMTDLSGFGNHLVQPDEELRGILADYKGYKGIELDGSKYYLLGAPGAFEFPHFTAWLCYYRDSEDDGTSYILFHGRRSTSVSAVGNQCFAIGARDSSSLLYRVTATGSTTPGAGGTKRVPHSISFRTLDRQLRSDGVDLLTPGSPITNSYFVQNEQALMGAAWNGQNYLGFATGIFFGAAFVDVDVDDNLRFRMERQLGTSAGLDL